ncbi:MAG TPA: transcriptional regulator [Anaeromyxobacteraceae bacterium]|nr:transcriptional regulator [Anaeromyxobacteraceae bacterium]
MPRVPPAGPPPRTSTVREALAAALREGPATAHELSSRAGIRERDVAEHLEHLARSLAAQGGELRVTPASCIACGFTFRKRERLARPSACPRCRSTRIDPPVFALVPEGGGKG